MLARPRLADTELRVLPTPPVDHQHDLAGLLVDIGDDVVDQSPQEALARPGGRCRRVLGSLQVIGQPVQVGKGRCRLRRFGVCQALLARRNALQGGFPVLLKLRGDQPVVGITGSIAALGQARLLTRPLQLQLDHPQTLTSAFHPHPLRRLRRLDRHRLHDLQQFPSHRGIDTGTPNDIHGGRPILRLDWSQRYTRRFALCPV